MCRWLVEDGAHVEQDMQYAEVEAMKQIMLLTSPASGHIHFQARGSTFMMCILLTISGTHRWISFLELLGRPL